MNRCKYCGKPLTLTPEYDTCIECQGRIMREATMPQNSFTTPQNSSTTNLKKLSMNIYDEAIDELNHELSVGNIGIITRDNILEALERAKKVEELLKQYQVLAHDYEVLSNNKDRTKLGLLIFAVEEGKRIIKQLEEELK